MRVIEHTTKVLKIQFKGLVDILIVWFMPVFGMLTILAISFFITQANLSCNRANTLSLDIYPTQVVCKLVKSSMWTEKVNILENLQGAKTDSHYDQDSNWTYRAILITNNKQIPLTESYTSRKLEISRHVAEINAFIDNPNKPSLNIYEDHRWIPYLVGVIFFILGISFLFVKFLTSCTFDKNSDRLYVKSQNSIFQSDIREESLENIKMAKVDITTNDKGKKIYSAKIVLKSEEFISLGLINDQGAIVKTINDFLNLNDYEAEI